MNGRVVAPPSAPSPARPGFERLFGLEPDDARLLAEHCAPILAQAGIDPGRFFERLDGGGTMGEALGLPPEAGELIYARAHRWFAVDRPDRAEPLFRALCIADGRQADHWAGLGICLRIRAELAQARLAFAMASYLRPGWAVAHFHAGELELHAGELEEAAALLALFERTRDDDTPPAMVAEARRMALALALRRGRQAGPPAP